VVLVVVGVDVQMSMEHVSKTTTEGVTVPVIPEVNPALLECEDDSHVVTNLETALDPVPLEDGFELVVDDFLFFLIHVRHFRHTPSCRFWGCRREW